MCVPEKVSYFSRFFVKFAEAIAVGLATAVGGYLIAHLGGLSSSRTPAAIQIAPSASGVSSPPAHPASPVSAEAAAPHAYGGAASAEDRERHQGGASIQAHQDRHEHDRKPAAR